jgi:hypothetical protein
VQVSGRAGTVLTGEVAATLEAMGEAEYYEDGHAARNEVRARIDAAAVARRQFDEAARQRLDEAQR